MDPSLLEWLVTFAGLGAVLGFDLFLVARRVHEPSMREVAIRLSCYIGLAVAFGVWVWHFHGAKYGMQFYAGWLTEYSLSVDNLFVFVIIMNSFNVPKKYRQEALFVGIILALSFRAVFIALGGVAVQRLSWTFYVFGAFMAYTAIKLLRHSDPTGEGEGEGGNNAVVRFARTHFNATDRWAGVRFFVRDNAGAWAVTPMFLVALALGTTDLVFAMDSIPAIYGLTRQPYLVFTANVFALMGLRQLFFILGKLLSRLVYLSQGLAVILGFIGVRMVLHALRTNEVWFINSGRPLNVPEIPTPVSLGVVVGVLLLTTGASLYRTRGATSAQ
ncbi:MULTISPECIES: TerC/Alx family metal homeostasis membrane protein [Mycolicibacter]|uniref:Tellurium resistance protein TerC n=1 Tax=Mycolicibacter virginiensis TaxID=1795032 RepID=A0A9X7NYZ4_9MYCO|nr:MULTISPECIES: TerC/Alx family metal homeostasis membrane protein [Mycobacteriaceae]OBG38386.1 tellurium resistance protein TerC [Mycolicibacter heraklionensis]OBJ31830.1 tellurium resistance protein TerC [Mycolicibacter heraklionensis]PQM52569.1 tellurium resistance protein TerC [Mycolicibacter virginiensis]ULP47258.1 TerC/Alx family metal homeostasis membrane protein [Mycolicibacter virginiensis]